MKKILTATTLSFAILSFDSNAKENKTPLVEGEVVVEFHANEYFNSKNRNNEYHEDFFRTEFGSTINLPSNFTIESMLVFEKINDEQGNRENRSFDSGEGAFIEELKLRYTHNDFSIFAGKFNPAYGIAWDWGRGIWTHKLAENYEQTQKIGFGATYAFSGNELEVAFFHNDRKHLDNTRIVRQNAPNQKNDGSPGNTDNFQSYSINLNAEDAFDIKGLSYHIGHLNLAIDNYNTSAPRADQKGYVVGLGYIYEVNDDLNFDSLVEYNKFTNLDGNANTSQDFYTANVITNLYKNWNITTGYAKMVNKTSGAGNANTTSLQLSGGYAFGEESVLNGLSLEVGIRELREPGSIQTRTAGFLARYIYAF